VTAAGTAWDGFRFNAKTGETWWPNTNNPDWVWQKAIDSKQFPAGDFDLQEVVYSVNNQLQEQVIRIDRKTGRSWILDSGTWDDIAEPADFANEPMPQSGFRLLMSASASDWSTFRFNPETGEAWAATSNGGKLLWKRIVDFELLALSDFDFQTVSFVPDDVGNTNNTRTIRIDRRTGRSWVALNGKWTAIFEPAGYADSSSTSFRLVMAASANSWYAYRINTKTGETWLPHTDTSGTVWQAIAETNQLPFGDYDLQVAPTISDKGPLHHVLRMERRSGRTWLESNDRAWNMVLERPDIAATHPPQAGFRLVASSSADGWYAIRFNPETGETWVPNKYGQQWINDRWVDKSPLAKGNYDVQMASFDDKNGGTENVFRLNRGTGQSWVFVSSNWTLVCDLSGSPAPPGGYQLLLSLSSICDAACVNPQTGETWKPIPTNPMVWGKLVDEQQLPAGVYTVKKASYVGPDNMPYITILRINAKTGQAWYATDTNWLPIAEPK
jgi:hypothetical protein